MKTGTFLISIRGSFFNYVDNHGQNLVNVVKERPTNSIQDKKYLTLKKGIDIQIRVMRAQVR